MSDKGRIRFRGSGRSWVRVAGDVQARRVTQATTGPTESFSQFGQTDLVRRLPALTLAVAALVVAAGCVPPGAGSSRYHYMVPVAPGVTIGYGAVGSHHDYPAADIFASTGCGTPLVAPVDGRVLELRTVDLYDPAADNPAYRGGRYVSIQGVDGVRYYLAHLESAAAGLTVGQDVQAGEVIGAMGRSGNAGACHLHFGVSVPC